VDVRIKRKIFWKEGTEGRKKERKKERKKGSS